MLNEARRVLFIHSGADGIRGSEQALLDLMAHLPRCIRPAIACDAPSLLARCESLGIPSYPIPGPLGGLHDERPMRPALRERVSAVFSFVRPDVVHVNAVIALPWVLGCAWRRGVPVIAHMHLLASWSERHLTGLHQASFIVAPSKVALSGLVEDGVPASRLKVVPNAVDPKRLAGRAAGDAMRRSQADCVIACIGALVPGKAVDQCIRIAAGLIQRGYQVRLRIAGDGPERGRLEKLAEQQGVLARVEFMGHVPIDQALLDADFLLTSSRQEVFPLTVLEAAYAGLPVIASDIAAHGEAVVDGVTGRLFPVDDVEAGVAVAAEVLGNQQMACAMAEAARQRATAEFSLGRYVRSFSELYCQLCEAPRARYRLPFALHWPSSYWDWLRTSVGRRLGLP